MFRMRCFVTWAWMFNLESSLYNQVSSKVLLVACWSFQLHHLLRQSSRDHRVELGSRDNKYEPLHNKLKSKFLSREDTSAPFAEEDDAV